jgi:uncharacterized protein YjiS (DUF1127 family)
MQYANTIWKRPARRSLNADAWRRRIADAAASATTRFVTDLAFAASGMYPELQWPLIDHINQRDSAEGMSANRPHGAAIRRSMSQPQMSEPQERRAIANDRVQLGSLPRLVLPRPVADRGDLSDRPVAPAARAGRSIPAWIASLGSLPGLLWRRLRREREMWQNLAELETLDDRTLKDIGLSRCEIELIAGGEHRWRY